jgi:hypothetical protein
MEMGLATRYVLKAVVDRAENVANDRAQNQQGRDNNNGNQNKNQRIFDQTLTLLVACKQHGILSFLQGGPVTQGPQEHYTVRSITNASPQLLSLMLADWGPGASQA